MLSLGGTSTESEHQVKGRLLLNVVVREGSAVFKLFASEDEALLVGRNTLFVLDLGLHILDSVSSVDLESNRLSGESLDEDLHDTASESEDEVECGLLLDVVVGEGAAIVELLTREDQSLLIRGDALLVLDLGLHGLNRVGGLNFQGDGLASQGLNENLHDFLFLVKACSNYLFLILINFNSQKVYISLF